MSDPAAIVAVAAIPIAGQVFVPIDVVALVQAVFTGLAALMSAGSLIWAALAAARSKRAEDSSKLNSASLGKVVSQVDLVERNTNSITTRLEALARKEGIQIGIDQQVAAGNLAAASLVEGQRQGAKQERDSVAAAAASAPAPVHGASASVSGGATIEISDAKISGQVKP